MLGPNTSLIGSESNGAAPAPAGVALPLEGRDADPAAAPAKPDHKLVVPIIVHNSATVPATGVSGGQPASTGRV